MISGFSKNFNNTDLGNARRLIEKYGESIHYVTEWHKWMVWDNTRWVLDATDQVMQMAKETVNAIYLEASNAGNEAERRAICDHAKRSESAGSLRAMVDLARSEPGVAISANRLDADPYLFNCANCTVRLGWHDSYPHRREDLITKISPVIYDKNAKCSRWKMFIDEISCEDAELAKHLQGLAGYFLTGDVSHQELYILYGTGANGKTTFLNILQDIMGDYAIQTPVDTLLVKQGNSIPNDIARLKGARLVCAGEADDGRRLSESFVKQVTGGDTVTGRFLYGEHFDFRPTCKICIAANNLPEIRETDEAMWRRVHVIPFRESFTGARQWKGLPIALARELPGILAWAVDGAYYMQTDFHQPAAVIKAVSEYRSEMSAGAAFITACCTLHPYAEVSARELHDAYSLWSSDTGAKRISDRELARILENAGCKRKRSTGGRYVWQGIKIKVHGSGS